MPPATRTPSPAPTGTALRPFSASLPMALLRAREAAMRRFRPHLAQFDLTEQQWRVLRALASTGGGLEVGGLAEATNLLAPSLSRILTNLDGRGLTTRTTVPHDQRRARIALTDDGRELVDRVAPGSEDRYREIEERFGPERLDALLCELGALTRLLSESEAHPPESDRA